MTVHVAYSKPNNVLGMIRTVASKYRNRKSDPITPNKPTHGEAMTMALTLSQGAIMSDGVLFGVLKYRCESQADKRDSTQV